MNKIWYNTYGDIVMDEIKFNSLNELYNRLYPAFNTKKVELERNNIKCREIDIWNFLKETIWRGSENLSIYDMVNDIMLLDENKLKNYINRTK